MTVLIPYTLGIPDGPNNPSQDQPNMKLNNDAIAQFLAVDHIPFDVNNSGFHKVIHQLDNGSDPVPINSPPTGQLYTKNVTITNSAGSVTDTQLFQETGLGTISQLTGSNAASNGFQFLGGVIIQWGVVNSITNGNVVFNTAPNFDFPLACFSVQTTPFWVGATIPDGAAGISVKSISKTGFEWVFNTNSSRYSGGGFYWIAIGN